MVDLARKEDSKTTFFVGNILESPELCPGPYASITSFRFLLNVDPVLRPPILDQLNRRLLPNGALIVDLHGNRRSLRHPAILWKKWKYRHGAAPANVMLNEMSQAEVEKLLEIAGFQVEEIHGFGILPPTLYRLPLNSIWRALDGWLSHLEWLNPYSIDLVFVCSKKNPAGR